MSDNNGKRKVCSECGSDAFLIVEATSCDKCHCNGVWDEENTEYTHDIDAIKALEKEQPESIERTQCSNECECSAGSNNNAGCWMFQCVNCYCSDMIPRTEY